MFRFNYLIYDNIKEKLKKYSLEEFERKGGIIYGAFELIINNEMYNYIVRYESQIFHSIEEKKRFEELFDLQDVLSTWISIFLEISIYLEIENYIGIMDIESVNWIEFRRDFNDLYITEIEGEKVYPNINSVIVYEKFYEENKEKDKEHFFRNEKINFNEFKKEIENTAKEFIEEIRKLNAELLKSKEMKNLIKKYNKLSEWLN